MVFSLGQLGGENVGLETPFALLQGALVTWAIGRVGLLGGAAMVMFRQVLGSVPLPLDVSAPYMPTTLIVLASMLALAAYALRISVGTRRLLSIEAFEH